MKNDGKFLIYVSERYYWDLDLVPFVNDADEPCNRCALVDSKEQKEIHVVNFDSTWLIPIFQSRNQIGMKELATKLKAITDVLGLKVTPKEQMPEDKVAKSVEKAVKTVIKKEN